jgi:membrane protein implicated in regulation of membrane protease activity
MIWKILSIIATPFGVIAKLYSYLMEFLSESVVAMIVYSAFGFVVFAASKLLPIQISVVVVLIIAVLLSMFTVIRFRANASESSIQKMEEENESLKGNVEGLKKNVEGKEGEIERLKGELDLAKTRVQSSYSITDILEMNLQRVDIVKITPVNDGTHYGVLETKYSATLGLDLTQVKYKCDNKHIYYYMPPIRKTGVTNVSSKWIFQIQQSETLNWFFMKIVEVVKPTDVYWRDTSQNESECVTNSDHAVQCDNFHLLEADCEKRLERFLEKSNNLKAKRVMKIDDPLLEDSKLLA